MKQYQIDRPGVYRTLPTQDITVETAQSGAIAAVVKFIAIEMYENGQWIDWNYGQEIYCRVWIVKKDGTVNQNGVNTLKNVLGWDGDMQSFGTGWNVPACQVTVEAEEYKGETQYRGSWINAYDADPERGMRPADPEIIKKIQSMYGARLRAAYGAKSVPPGPKQPESLSEMDDEIPFDKPS